MLPEAVGEETLADRLARLIQAHGPISIAHYISLANAHYYGSRDPLGRGGDFTTAPEISQMFGELVGLWLADMQMRSGVREGASYVELGPGRGTLAADALRAMAAAVPAPRPHFVEQSPALRERQRIAVPLAQFHDTADSLPRSGPILAVANEFFDALPTRQFVKLGDDWRERMVDVAQAPPGAGDRWRFLPIAGPLSMRAALPAWPVATEDGAIVESSTASASAMLSLCQRIAEQGGAALIIDYGYEGPAVGDTLQAVRQHRFADPFADPGDVDLTTHVDFTLLANCARQSGLAVHGPVGQGAFLEALGIGARAQALVRSRPDRVDEVETARVRLTDPDQMGILFKVLAVRHPDWPVPEGL